MADAIHTFLPIAKERSQILNELGLSTKGYALATIHRAGNTDDPQKLSTILSTFNQLPLPVVFPVHPRTKKMIASQQIQIGHNIRMIDPIGYLDMLCLEAHADCILTNSGGVQKEAYWCQVRCITLREETEWVETVEVGWNRVVGVDPERIVESVRKWRPPALHPPIYGDNQAAEHIVSILQSVK